jgi:two-component system KDP operon response regulator KdpE
VEPIEASGEPLPDVRAVQQLFDAVWGRSHGDAQQYLRVFVAHLRRKLERDPLRPALIVTEPGVGYRFDLGGPRGPGE